MKYTLHDFQVAVLNDATAWLASRGNEVRRLYASPTGTGKSIMELALLEAVPSAILVTPRLEIIAGMLDKLGENPAGFSTDKLVVAGEAARLYTPVRLRNRMMAGEFPAQPGLLILDECHHHSADTWQQLDLLTGCIPTIGFTATPYRGTPRGTAAFREAWGEPVWAITIPEAVERGYLAFPDLEILPLLDDDEIEIVNGEFSVSSVSAATQSRLAALVEHCGKYASMAGWDRPTMFAVPDTETAVLLSELLNAAGLPAAPVTQATTRRTREQVFRATVDRWLALVQINVVSEGVDLPIRRLIDVAPMLSPVRWLQQLGRITRPSDEPPHYVCTNRNVLRHAYLLDGMVPAGTLASAIQSFGGVGKRAAVRAIGLEAVGRLKASELPLQDGCTALAYQVSAVRGCQVVEYACLVHPARPDPLWATRTRVRATETNAATYGKWRRCEPPEGLKGFASVPPAPLSEKQAAWWKRAASRHGLDPDAKVTRKNFVALPVLADLKERL